MSEFIIKLFIFLVGAGVGFSAACLGAAQLIVEKHDLKKKVAELEEADRKAKEAALNTPQISIDISDPTKGDGVDFSQKW